MVTRTGLEGGPVYAIGAAIRDAARRRRAVRPRGRPAPGPHVDQLAERLRAARPKDSGSNWLRRSIGLDPVAIALLREASGGALPSDAADDRPRWSRRCPCAVTGDDADRARDLDRRRHRVVGGRRVAHAAAAARHVRRGRDARLGGADGRLPAAGLVQHRGRRGAGCAGLARALCSAAVVADARGGQGHQARRADRGRSLAGGGGAGAGVRARAVSCGSHRAGRPTGSVTSKPRLRRIGTAPVPPWNSSDVARRPVAYRCATPRTARGLAPALVDHRVGGRRGEAVDVEELVRPALSYSAIAWRTLCLVTEEKVATREPTSRRLMSSGRRCVRPDAGDQRLAARW